MLEIPLVRRAHDRDFELTFSCSARLAGGAKWRSAAERRLWLIKPHRRVKMHQGSRNMSLVVI